MNDILRFPCALLWGEREIVSVANPMRRDGIEFFELAPKVGIVRNTTGYPLPRANEALSDIRRGALQGAAVLVP
jgi:propanol-preferring alcohol dehydrogenase